MHAFVEVTVYECSQRGVTCHLNWSEAGHVLVELGDEVGWIHWVGCQSQ
jgi:hypothetical protein